MGVADASPTIVVAGQNPARPPGERELYLSEINALREENKNLREVRQQIITSKGNATANEPQAQYLPAGAMAVNQVVGTPPMRCHAMAGLLQARGVVPSPTGLAASPQALWAPRSGTGSPSPNRPQSPPRQVSSPVRQRSGI